MECVSVLSFSDFMVPRFGRPGFLIACSCLIPVTPAAAAENETESSADERLTPAQGQQPSACIGVRAGFVRNFSGSDDFNVFPFLLIVGRVGGDGITSLSNLRDRLTFSAQVHDKQSHNRKFVPPTCHVAAPGASEVQSV